MVEAADVTPGEQPQSESIADQEQVSERAKNKIGDFLAYKNELLSKLKAVEACISENTLSEQNPEGLLANNGQNLLECLQTTTTKFRELLRQEEAHWAQNYLLSLLPPEP